jgi:serine/threonine-protein kinase
MKAGQKFGPFVIEKPLGSGAMGTVYRALYTKTGGRVALKVIAPGLTDNANSRARFEREIEILKQLKHPNIVRFFGGRTEQGHTAFYAMEYVEGESLDHVMQRRDKLTWEEVVALGQQICSALQHAHEHGIIHRDLKPSNLMVLPDGTIKLTDFGIALDLDDTRQTQTNCTVGTASYMSPEQCRGERNLTHKSDLYSLGILFYELLTGGKPFKAETPMDMFMQHINGTFERPSRVVLETPVWLDTLICQLLEKKPEQRPRDAEMVATALNQVAEKVAALQSAGVDVVRARAIDRPRAAAGADETDKEAARALRQAVTGRKLRRKRKPLHRQVWVQALGLGAFLVLAVVLLYLALQPPSAERLHAQARPLMNSANPEDWERANEKGGPLALFRYHYGTKDTPFNGEMQAWTDKVGKYERAQTLERLLRSHKGKTPIRIDPEGEVQKLALKATIAEDAGDLPRAQKAWQELQQKYPPITEERTWNLLATDRLKDLSDAEALAKEIEAALKTDKPFKPDKDWDEALVHAVKVARGADSSKARECWDDLRSQFETNAHQRKLVLLAADQIFKLKKSDADSSDKKPKEKT